MASINTSKGIFKYRRKYIYDGMKPICKDQALENLSIMTDILNRTGLHWGPCWGTLLGMVREHDFISWDEDIDLYILSEDEELFRTLLWELKDAGFDLVRYERRGLYSIMRKGEYIDFYVLEKIADNLRQTKGGSYLFEKYVQDTIPYDFKGVTLSIPREYDEYLTFQYGDWRTPVQFVNYEAGKLQILKAKVSIFIKNTLLPDRIYFNMLKRHHLKDFEKFKQKCIKKGCPLSEDIHI